MEVLSASLLNSRMTLPGRHLNLITILLLVTACSHGPSPPESAEAERKSIRLPDGLRLELVAEEPMVEDPVVIYFDEYNRMWVVEMRGFMPNAEGAGEHDRVGRVSILTDTDGDGIMDHRETFLDSLILPRAITVTGAGVLIAEDKPLWLAKDTNGDLHADTKELIDSAYGGSGLPEHSGNGLWRGMDNWYYNAKSYFRYKLQQRKWIRDSTEFRGQWGISHDDKGRLFYNYNWSQLHADLVPPNTFSRNPHHKPTSGIDEGLTLDRRVYPIRSTPAVNRGYIPGTLDKDQKLLEFTAACSPFVYRGTALPETYEGNAFVCEPAGNLIKRNIIEERSLVLASHDAYEGKEFLASSDERFRPVYLASGPDGALYVVDMYRGIIQDGAYMTPYLKDQSVKRNLDKPVNRGRIWRVVPDNWKRPKIVKLGNLSTSALVPYLSDPNGWYRDMAQRLLVERADSTVGDALERVVSTGTDYRGRLQALWTMEGLGMLTPGLCRIAMNDTEPIIQSTSLRLIAPFLKDKTLRIEIERKLLAAWEKAPPEVELEMLLIADRLDKPVSFELMRSILSRDSASPLMRDAAMSSLGNNEYDFLNDLMAAADWHVQDQGKEIFLEMLASATMVKGDPMELSSLLGGMQQRRSHYDWRDMAIMNGLAAQARTLRSNPVSLRQRPQLFESANGVDAQTRNQLEVLAAAFRWPGKKEMDVLTVAGSQLDEKALKQFAAGRQLFLADCAACHGTNGAGMPRSAPPLIQSEWVLGDPSRLSLILLHGMEGAVEVNGRHYDEPDILPQMPSHSILDDSAIAAILTYIRNEWGNQANPVKGSMVGHLRVANQGKIVPWTASELQHWQPAPEGNTPKK